jgi:cob(I)alamin adenosyltransferase
MADENDWYNLSNEDYDTYYQLSLEEYNLDDAYKEAAKKVNDFIEAKGTLEEIESTVKVLEKQLKEAEDARDDIALNKAKAKLEELKEKFAAAQKAEEDANAELETAQKAYETA